MSTRRRLLLKIALHVELDDRQQRAASGALIAWRENLLRVSAMAKLFARLVVLVVSPTALMMQVVLDAQLAGQTQLLDRRVATLCHQAPTSLRTEQLIRAFLVTLVLERILLLLLAQKEATLLQEAPLHASSVRQESMRQTRELRIAQSVKKTSISQMLERQRVSLCCLVTIELVQQRKSTVRQESLV